MRVVLPSNSSMQDYYPDNNLATYTVKIPTPLDFSVGKWECALTEIQFFKSWCNVTKQFISFSIGDKESVKIEIPDSYYSTPSELIKIINEKIMDEWAHHEEYGFTLTYNEHTKKIRVKLLTVRSGVFGLTFDLSDSLGTILGIKNVKRVFHSSEYSILEGTEPVHLIHLYDIMVYTDIIQGSIVGDTEAPLLRAVSVDPGHWSKQCTIYERPQYFPLSKTKFQSISILLRTDTGKSVPFTNGRTIATLDFRRIKPYY